MAAIVAFISQKGGFRHSDETLDTASGGGAATGSARVLAAAGTLIALKGYRRAAPDCGSG